MWGRSSFSPSSPGHECAVTSSRLLFRSASALDFFERTAGVAAALRAPVLAFALLGSCAASLPSSGSSPAALPQASDPCLARIAKWESLQSSIKTKVISEGLASIRAAASVVGEDPEGCVADRVDSAVESVLRQAVVLETGAESHQAIAVYSCPALREEVQCAGRKADDTAHLSEAPRALAAVPTGATARIRFAEDFPLKKFQLYRQAEHGPAAQRPVPIKVELRPDGRIELPATGQASLMFGIAQDQSGEFHKWVWLLRGS